MYFVNEFFCIIARNLLTKFHLKGEAMSRLEFLLSKIRVIFLGSDEFLLKEVKKVCAKTKKFTALNYDEGEFGLNLAKNFDIALCEVRNSHCVEFIEDISYENPNLKIIALEPSLALNGGGGECRL